MCRDKTKVFNAIYLSAYSTTELLQKLADLSRLSYERVRDIYVQGPELIHVQMNDDVLRNIKEETMFSFEIMQENQEYIFVLKRTK